VGKFQEKQMKRYLIFGLAIAIGACNSNGGEDKDIEGAANSSDTQLNDEETSTATPNQPIEESSDSEENEGSSPGTETDDELSLDSETEEDAIRGTELSCPDGTTLHTSSSGRMVCCSESNPIFCDETPEGYNGGCWSDGVDCNTITFCGDTWTACLEDSLPFCNEDGGFLCYPCGDDTVRHETASGRPVCCTPDRPTFCDENEIGYSGGCWSDGVDCETITMCGDTYTACLHGALPFCGEDSELTCYPCPGDSERYETISGRPICCTADKPYFCDENENGYLGGCWSDGMDCSTVIYCNGFWGGCSEGMQPSCEDGSLSCQ
jgi:hypothetical protein